MLPSRRRWLWATVVAVYLYYLLPATANLFFELYHLTGIGPVYWGYSGFKAAGYYFGVWEYRLPACVLVFLLILILPLPWRRRKTHEQT